jgi:hypothetical protein
MLTFDIRSRHGRINFSFATVLLSIYSSDANWTEDNVNTGLGIINAQNFWVIIDCLREAEGTAKVFPKGANETNLTKLLIFAKTTLHKHPKI